MRSIGWIGSAAYGSQWIEWCRLVDVVDRLRQMLADVADITDRKDVGSNLLLDLQIVLLDESIFEVGSFGHKRQASDRCQVSYIGSRRGRNRNCAADDSGSADG